MTKRRTHLTVLDTGKIAYVGRNLSELWDAQDNAKRLMGKSRAFQLATAAKQNGRA